MIWRGNNEKQTAQKDGFTATITKSLNAFHVKVQRGDFKKENFATDVPTARFWAVEVVEGKMRSEKAVAREVPF